MSSSGSVYAWCGCRERATGRRLGARGDLYHDSGYVITSLNGDPLAPARLSRYFRRLSAAAGPPPSSSRHTGKPPCALRIT